MIGVDVRNTQIKRFEEAVKRGEILIMVDVPKDRVETIEDLVHNHPHAQMGGVEPPSLNSQKNR